MITGLEPLLGPPLTKCAGAGAAKLAGWGATDLLQARRRRKIRALTHSKARAPQLEAVESLSTAELQTLQEFCGSVEVEHIATSLARAYLLEGAGKSTDKLMRSVRSEFDASLGLRLGDGVDPLVSDAIFDAISEAVLKNVGHLLSRPKLAASVEGELIATAGSLAAASVRNVEVLKGIDNLLEIRSFEQEYKSQAAAIHATMRLPHAGTTQQVPYRELFVEPRVWTDSTTPGVEEGARAKTSVDFMMCMSTRVVVLGDPGGGKSTLSRKLTYDLAADQIQHLGGRVPFFVELRDFAPSVRGRGRQTLVEYLEQICKSPYNIEAPESAVEYLLLNGRAVVVLDGLDELLDVSLRRDVVQAVEGFAHRYPTCPMVVTSRRIGYEEAPLNEDLFRKVSLSEFDTPQVRDYVYKWFTLDASIEEARQEQLADSFMLDSEFVTDLRVNPLMLSLMCGIYASESYIPRNRPDVYEKCALLLFERWDKQRGIVPELSFDAHVQAALRALALHMLNAEYSGISDPDEDEDGASTTAREGIPRSNLVAFLSKYLREKRFDNDEDAESAAIQFIDFCEGRAWVLTDVGAQTYGFTHRTFLEYFAASQLVRLHTSAAALYNELEDKIRAGGSDVVAQLAVQILGRTAEDGADDFLELVISAATGETREDGNLASFAARALNFVVPRPQVLDAVVVRCAELTAKSRRRSARARYYGLFSDLMTASAENTPRVAAALHTWLDDNLSSGPGLERSLLMAVLPPVHLANRSGDFWKSWAKGNLSRYADQIAAASSRFYWLAIVSLEAGSKTAAEVIDQHGPAALYDYRMTDVRDWPPLVWRMFRWSSGGGYNGLVDRVKPARASAIAQDLSRVLPSCAAPWVTWKNDYESTLGALHADKISPWPAAQILTALPLLERGLGNRGRIINVPLLAELAQVRAGAPRAATFDEQLASAFADLPESLTFVNEWLAGRFTLVAEPAKRSSKASTKS